MITGFLNASGFPEATVSTVGQALSRLRREKIIYRYPATFTYTYYPLALAKISTIRRCPECGSTRLMRDYESAEVVCMDCGYVIASKIAGGGYRLYGKKETVTTSEVMGEPVYGIPTATRMKILERLKFEPYFEWWKPEILKYTPPTIPKLKKPVEYEWIRFKKPAPRFRSAEDFKYYGPYRKGDLAKLPLIFAYFLVRTGYAEWLNPKKENVREAEKIFKYKSIEKMRRRATLLEY
ncbi:hypothetical protein DRO59_00330 [Candidatus Bathyarchaeota archaeon]|nr:MAG: hypothetical protein DRO59_00330 [Candidatus Bathyarchaeota archaeon]